MANWFPEPYQIKIERNDNWLHSAWIGITMPFLNCWRLAWHVWVVTFFRSLTYTFQHLMFGNAAALFAYAWLGPLKTAIRTTLWMMFIAPAAGLSGNLQSTDATLEDFQ